VLANTNCTVIRVHCVVCDFSVGQTPQPSSVEDQIERVRKENEALREQIRKIEEQQKALQESIKPSQPADATKGEAPLSGSGSAGTETAVSPAPPEAVAAPAPPPQGASPAKDERFRDGMIIWQTAADAEVPFLLKFNDDTQLRYLNTLNSDDTFTDHLGNVREVHRRNDITVNRQMFNFSATSSTKGFNTASRSGLRPAPPRS
jgi:hypothetical protein